MHLFETKSSVTLKPSLGVTQDCWKWHHLIDCTQLPTVF